jgi:hypothetical protein
MTMEDFNALPLEVRRFIEAHAGCLACGNSTRKLDEAYALYKSHRKMKTYQLIGGGVNFAQGEDRGVLVPVRDTDEPAEIREKIRIAKLIHKTNPEVFSVFDENEIELLLKSLPAEKVIQLDAKKELTQEQKDAAAAEKVKADQAKAEAAAKKKADAAAKGLATKAANAALAEKARLADEKAKADAAEAKATGSDADIL